MAGAGFLRFNPKYFTLILLSILGQHFILLSFLPFQLKDLMTNIFFLGSAVVINVVIQFIIFELSEKISMLEGFLPICASCKKVRDDKGYWNQIESYIRAHSDVKFTHGYCPECFEEEMKKIRAKE